MANGLDKSFSIDSHSDGREIIPKGDNEISSKSDARNVFNFAKKNGYQLCMKDFANLNFKKNKKQKKGKKK